MTPIHTVPRSNRRPGIAQRREGRPERLQRAFRHGDLVRVRSEAEILATLDDAGRLDGLPFMPEMLRYCGGTFEVYKRADKTCDTIGPGEHRRLHDTVHLQGLRCGGEDHGGCQAACLLFWKEQWLEPVGEARTATDGAAVSAAGEGAVSTEELRAAARVDDRSDEAAAVYQCQATELVRASTRLPWWDVRQYVRDVRSGNVGVGQLLAGFARWFFVVLQHRATGSTVPFVRGRLMTVPRVVTGLRANDRVRVNSRREIEATLDVRNRNHGLSFDSEMLRYTGKEMRVLQRVERLIDEKTGRMREIPSDCIILDGAICTSAYHRFCPRAIYPYWREAWLTRLDDAGGGETA